MLETAKKLSWFMVAYWHYATKIEHDTQHGKGPGRRPEFLLQGMHSEKAKLFRCQPLKEWLKEVLQHDFDFSFKGILESIG